MSKITDLFKNTVKDMDQLCIKTAQPDLFGAVKLDRLVTRRIRILFLRISLVVFIFSLAAYVFFQAARTIPSNVLSFAGDFNFLLLYAFLLISGSVLSALLFAEFFYTSSLKPNIVFIKEDLAFKINFDVAYIFYSTGFLLGFSDIDVKKFHRAIFDGGVFNFVLLRLGASPDDYSDFISRSGGGTLGKVDFIEALMASCLESDKNIIGISEIAGVLYEKDKTFEKFLFDLKINKKDLIGAASWVSNILGTQRAELFVWEKGHLSRIPGMAKDLGFGYTFELDKYSVDITGRSAPAHLGTRRKEIFAIEDALSKSGKANILLVADEGSGKHTVIEGVAKMIREGKIAPSMEHKRMVLLDIASIAASTKSKGNFEGLIIKIMNEAVSAGNIILVMEDLNYLVKSAYELGSDFISLIEPYLAGARIQAIATSDQIGFHKSLSRSGKVTKLFETVELEEVAEEKNLLIIEEVAEDIERTSDKMFTYQALKKVLEVADRYVVEGVMPEKAVNLLDELAYSGLSGEGKMILVGDVETFITRKTNIPLGAAEEEEKDLLLNLEKYLHERIVAQEEAIRVISESLRRTRAGLRDKNKPIGSFLFLGPTGVGKTETAKALADLYFKGEEAMVRFDMSEFQGEEGFKKLIGSFETGEPGILSTKVRERPYGIFLFDELEKSSKEILNLFLQILDEGFFTDFSGKRISLRETLIIATSNAGSNIIWDMLKSGSDISQVREKVIDAVRQEGKFSPELLNRFDAVVIYKSLGPAELVKVATLMLGEFVGKLKKQDITLEITEALINKVAKIGYNPVMGARPMRRAIADKVEGIIAKKILKGDLKRGDVFKFTDEEVNNL